MDGFLRRTGVARYVGDFVYGANDGIITTFAVVAGVAGAQLSSTIVIILGLANLIADGISMAASNYLATRSEEDYLEQEKESHTHSKNALHSALVTFIGFVAVGFMPLVAYIFSLTPAFQWATTFAGIALFSVGAGRTIVTKKSWIRNGLEMLLIGAAAGGAAYSTGALLQALI